MLGIMIFLTVVLALTAGGHYALYRFTLRLLNLAHPFGRGLMLAAFAVLAVSFMAAFLLLRWQETPLTVTFYRLAAVWFAVFVNLLLAVAAAWLAYGLLRLAGFTVSSFPWVAGACTLAALAVSSYGFWNAFHPRTTRLEVRLENLPQSWRGKTIVQLSDVHLGHFHGTAGLERLAEAVDGLNPHMVVITGDLFDGLSDGLSGFAEPLRRLTAPMGVYMVTGNHEVYVGMRRAMGVLARTGIRVLENEVVDVEGLLLMGVAFPGIKDPGEIRGIERLSAVPARPCVLLFHTPADIRADGRPDFRTATYFRPETSFALARELGVALQLSGHTHAGQLFPFGLLTRLIYGGYDYGLNGDERFRIFTTSGVGTWGPPMRTGCRPEIVAITLNRK
jgi:hypothetical protein